MPNLPGVEHHSVRREELHAALIGTLALATLDTPQSIPAIRFVLRKALLHVMGASLYAVLEVAVGLRYPARIECSKQLPLDEAVRLRDQLASGALPDHIDVRTDGKTIDILVAKSRFTADDRVGFPSIALDFETATMLPDPSETGVLFSGKALLQVLEAVKAHDPDNYLNIKVVQPSERGSVLIRGAGFRAVLPVIGSAPKR